MNNQIAIDGISYGVCNGKLIILDNIGGIDADERLLSFLGGNGCYSVLLNSIQQEKQLCDFLNALNEEYLWRSGCRLGYRYIIQGRVTSCIYYCRRDDGELMITNSTNMRNIGRTTLCLE